MSNKLNVESFFPNQSYGKTALTQLRKGDAILQKQATQDGLIQPSITPVNIAKPPVSTGADSNLSNQYDTFITQLQLLDNSIEETLIDLDVAYLEVENPDRDFRAKAKHNPEFEKYTDELKGSGIYDDMTVTELKRELTSRRIAYGARDNKAKLLDRLKQAITRNTPERKTSESPARENTLLPNSKTVERILDYYMDDDNSQPYDSDNASYSDLYDAEVARRLDAEELGEGDYDDEDEYEDDFHSVSGSTTESIPHATHDDGDVTTIASKYTDKTPSRVSYDSPAGSSGAYGDDDSSLTDTEYSTIKEKKKKHYIYLQKT